MANSLYIGAQLQYMSTSRFARLEGAVLGRNEEANLYNLLGFED